MISVVHGYWYLKRLRIDRPLLPENQRPPAVEDANPFKNFRLRIDTPIARRRKLREDRAEYAAVEKMKSDLLKAMELTGMVREREQKKKELVVCEEEMFQLEAAHAKKRKIEREDDLYRMRSGLWGARDESFDCTADAEVFRSLFPDPNEAVMPEEDGTEEHLPLEMRHLAFVKLVHLPGVSPFWGIPRLSRRGGGHAVYDPVSMRDVEALLIETQPCRPKKTSKRLIRLCRIASIIRRLRALQSPKYCEDQDEEEDAARDEMVKELGWYIEEPYVC